MPVSVGDQSPQQSFGEALRRERELRRIDLRDVSEATKINIRYLEALEHNDFTYLPAGAFTRGFIRAYARFIGTDEAEMVNAYLYELGLQEKQKQKKGREGQHGGLVHLMHSRSDAARRPGWLLAAVLALLLLLIAAIAVPVYLHSREGSPVAAAVRHP